MGIVVCCKQSRPSFKDCSQSSIALMEVFMKMVVQCVPNENGVANQDYLSILGNANYYHLAVHLQPLSLWRVVSQFKD